MAELPAWMPEWGSGIDPSGGTSGFGSSNSGANAECDEEEDEEDCLQKTLGSYSVERSVNRIAGFGIGSAITGAGAQGINKTAKKPRGGIAGAGPSGRYTRYTRRFFGNDFGRSIGRASIGRASIGRASIGTAAKVTGILGAGVAAWSLHGEALLIYLRCLEENR